MSMERETRKRPAFVWVITVWKTLGLLFSILSLALVYSGSIPLPREAQEAIDKLTVVDWTMSCVLLVLAAISIYLLFTLKRQAPFFLTGALLLSVIYSLFITHATPPGLVTFIGWGIEAAICIYAWVLLRNGVLGPQHQKQAEQFR